MIPHLFLLCGQIMKQVLLNPIEEISEIIKSKNPDTKFFVDAVQVAGKIPIDVQETELICLEFQVINCTHQKESVLCM